MGARNAVTRRLVRILSHDWSVATLLIGITLIASGVVLTSGGLLLVGVAILCVACVGLVQV